jgi:phosphoribosylformylglycinamidine cyclo-ligase
MYLSAGSNEVFADMRKMKDLGIGWMNACNRVQAVWGGGETPMLRDVVFPSAFEIGGSAWGMLIKPEEPLDSNNVRIGDRIIGVASSGVHDNGLTLARDIRSQRLQELGYQTPLADGKTFGEALMEPTVLYGPLVRGLRSEGVEIHSALNITGHGLAKIARATAPLQYTVLVLPSPQPVFGFIQRHSGLPDEKMYSKFNMGVGFVLIVAESSALRSIGVGMKLGYKLWDAGFVEESPTKKKRVVLPNGVNFTEKDVAVRT